jgi:sec-independent protein translocase protein TatA
MIINDILQPTHMLLILVVALLVLGPKRLPEATRAVGRGIHDFRSAISSEGGIREARSAVTGEAPASPQTTDAAVPRQPGV